MEPSHGKYHGSGEQQAPLPGAWPIPEPYQASDDLLHAVNTALSLRRPLLLEGEPGCGKTRLAYAIAYELGYPLKTVYIRSTSRAQDVLYSFDAVRRLYDLQSRREPDADSADFSLSLIEGSSKHESVKLTEADIGVKLTAANKEKLQYVRLGGLGEAIALAQKDIPSVVLIDEIDKADIDFPNDLLLVLDRLQFTIDEIPGWNFDALRGEDRARRRDKLPLVLITSNREKDLPTAFLRRCLFYFIDFPSKVEELAPIIGKHPRAGSPLLFDAAMKRFWELRKQSGINWRKAPGTSELLDWIKVMEEDEQAGALSAEQLTGLPLPRLPHLEVLIKTKSDRSALCRLIETGSDMPGSPFEE